VKAELGVAGAPDDPVFDSLIDAASSSIVSFTRRDFARQAYTETLAGHGDIRLMLARTPVIAVSAVSRDGAIITDYSIDERDAGFLYRRGGWGWTAQCYQGLSGSGRFLDHGSPMPRQEEPQFSVTYTAGYILPGQHLRNVVGLSAAAGDNSFNDSAAGFPALLKAGDVIETSGFAAAALNGRFLVSGTPTGSKVVVAATLTTEAAAANRSMRFLPPADVRELHDVERACVETVKAWYQGRGRDPLVTAETVGPMSMQFGAAGQGSLPPLAAALLRSWVRAA
jgi:hypothetical protein